MSHELATENTHISTNVTLREYLKSCKFNPSTDQMKKIRHHLRAYRKSCNDEHVMTHTHRDRWSFDVNDDATLGVVRNIAYKIIGRNDDQPRDQSTTPRHAKRVTKRTNVTTDDATTPNVKRVRVRRKNHDTNVATDDTCNDTHVVPVTTLPSIDDAMMNA